jgi:hypothetical protein
MDEKMVLVWSIGIERIILAIRIFRTLDYGPKNVCPSVPAEYNLPMRLQRGLSMANIWPVYNAMTFVMRSRRDPTLVPAVKNSVQNVIQLKCPLQDLFKKVKNTSM